jgi:tetratricopeptide (TPR) repeat protein
MEEVLRNYINDPRDPMNNFNLGRCYEDKRQLSAAIGFYLRVCEYGQDELLTYESLLRIALCLEVQGRRVQPLKGSLLRAVALLPKRPEAYFLLARTHEVLKEWQHAYAWASIGETIMPGNTPPLISDVQYPGGFGFIYEKAVVSWWMGLYHESLRLFNELKVQKLPLIYERSVLSNIENITRILVDKPIKKRL